MSDQATPIHDAVREYYSKHAVNSSSCCGDAGSCCESTLYNPELLTDLPADVTGFSLGCGDPITLAGLKPGDSVLDLGSGGGLDCFLAAKQVGETGRVIGVDMTPEMLVKARAAAEKIGVKNVEFREGFLEALPVEANSIDVVISNCVINLSPDKPVVFREVFRVLKPGGRIAVSDIVIQGELPEELRKDSQVWSACISGAIPGDEYARGLIEAGFTDVQVKPKGEFAEAQPLVANGVPYSAMIVARKP